MNAVTGFVALMTVFGAIGGLSGIVAVVNSRSNRRKTDSEAAQILTTAATSLIQPLRAEIDRLTLRLIDLENYVDQQRRVLDAHAHWDAEAKVRLRDAGIEMPDAPPLFPDAPHPNGRGQDAIPTDL